jgi:hypothetical protein
MEEDDVIEVFQEQLGGWRFDWTPRAKRRRGPLVIPSSMLSWSLFGLLLLLCCVSCEIKNRWWSDCIMWIWPDVGARRSWGRWCMSCIWHFRPLTSPLLVTSVSDSKIAQTSWWRIDWPVASIDFGCLTQCAFCIRRFHSYRICRQNNRFFCNFEKQAEQSTYLSHWRIKILTFYSSIHWKLHIVINFCFYLIFLFSFISSIVRPRFS